MSHLLQPPSAARPDARIARDFNAATRAADIVPHAGVTQLMFAPEDDIPPHIVARWHGLHDAITMAGGHVQVLANQFAYGYARDLGIVVNETVFYPTLTFENGRPDYRRAAFLPFVAHYGYALRPLDVLPDYAIDGGNFLPLPQHGIILTGQYAFFDAGLEFDMGYARAKQYIAHETGLRMAALGTSTWHVDSVAGALPDGRVLIKLDETMHEEDAARSGIEEPHITLMGANPMHVAWLGARIGRHNIVTFSMYDHPLADVVCGVGDVARSTAAARAFGLAANVITVNDTLVGETMPARLAERLRGDGIRLITPSDVGVDSFLHGDAGIVGGARCLTQNVLRARL